MGWFENQIQDRRSADQQLLEESFLRIAGVIMGENDDELLIVTNHHVVADSSELTVSFIDEESVEAVVKGQDASNDLAVVAVKLADIPAETMNQIRIANVADSEDVRVGEQVVAIGNALGYGQSVTTGIVSALTVPSPFQMGLDTMITQS